MGCIGAFPVAVCVLVRSAFFPCVSAMEWHGACVVSLLMTFALLSWAGLHAPVMRLLGNAHACSDVYATSRFHVPSIQFALPSTVFSCVVHSSYTTRLFTSIIPRFHCCYWWIKRGHHEVHSVRLLIRFCHVLRAIRALTAGPIEIANFGCIFYVQCDVSCGEFRPGFGIF